MSIEIQFISAKILDKKRTNVVEYILSHVRDERILVFDALLTPDEERALIEKTMRAVDGKFAGIEISTLSPKGTTFQERLASFLGIKRGFTVIGPSRLVKSLKRDPNSIHLFTVDRVDEGKKQ